MSSHDQKIIFYKGHGVLYMQVAPYTCPAVNANKSYGELP